MAKEGELVRYGENGGAPAQGLSEALTRQFHAWEIRGRGWQVCPYPVEIEPPFTPFLWHAPPSPPPGFDDGRRHTLASGFIARLKGELAPRAAAIAVPEEEVPEPEPAPDTDEYVAFRLAPPAHWKLSKDVAGRLLASLAHCRAPLSFELIGDGKRISAEIACGTRDASLLAAQLRAHCPEAGVARSDAALKDLLGSSGHTAAVDFGLSEEFMRPIRAARALDPDPLIAAVGALESLENGEAGILQVLFKPLRNPWAESITRAVTDGDGKAFFADAPEMVPLAQEKIAHPLYAAVVRVGARSTTGRRAWEIARAISSVFAQFADPRSNQFIPLENEGYPDGDHWDAILDRRSHRFGMILNQDELVSLVHPPSASVRSTKLLRDVEKTKAAPENTGDGVLIGVNRHRGIEREVRLSSALRMRHTYVIGASGTGKSTLLLSMMIQDIERGDGVALIDPHGDLADEVLPRIPEERLNDVIVFDPSDEERPVAWNILQAHTPVEKTLLASDMVATFKRLSTSWGDQMTSVLGNAVLAILESDRGGSVSDLRRFLVDAAWRKEYLASVKDPEIVFYWEKEFPLLAGRPQASILTRLDAFLRPRPVRAMVTARRDRLDFRKVLDERKIFLAKLAQGAIGEENSTLLGSLLVSKFHQTALSRQDAAPEARSRFFLYCDEFHHFITPSMASLLSGARKYRLGLTLAHQELRQLLSRDAEVAAAVLANPSTRIAFRVGEADAKKLEESFASFDARDLQNLGVGEAIVRIERSDCDFNLATLPVPEADPALAARRRNEAVRHTREAYGRLPEEAAPPAPMQTIAAPVSNVEAPSPVVERANAVRTESSSRDERAFVEYVGKHPGCFVTKAYRELGLSGYKGGRLKGLLIERGLVSQTETREGEGGRVAKVLTLTEAGVRFLAAPPAVPGKGGGRHKELQQGIREQAELLGWQAKIEERIAGGTGLVDIGLAKDGFAVAVEISVTTDTDHEMLNIRKCLKAGYDLVIAVSEEEGFREDLKWKCRKSFSIPERKKIHFVTPDGVRNVLLSVSGPGKGMDSGGKRVNSEYRNQNSLLGVDEAAELLDVSRETVYSWVSQRKIPFVKVGRLTKFARERLLEWVKKGEREERH